MLYEADDGASAAAAAAAGSDGPPPPPRHELRRYLFRVELEQPAASSL